MVSSLRSAHQGHEREVEYAFKVLDGLGSIAKSVSSRKCINQTPFRLTQSDRCEDKSIELSIFVLIRLTRHAGFRIMAGHFSPYRVFCTSQRVSPIPLSLNHIHNIYTIDIPSLNNNTIILFR